MLNAIVLLTLIATATLLAWWGALALRVKNRAFKWGGVGIAVMLAATVSVPSVLMIAGLAKLHTRSAPVPDLKVARTSKQIERGQALANSFCDACHSKTGLLTGSVDMATELHIPVGSLVSSNLTPAGVLNRWSDGEIFRAIRNAIDPDGHWLIVMSYTNAGKLSDDDIQALIAYIRSRPPAGESTANPPDQLNPLGLVMLGAGILPRGKPVFTGSIAAPPKGPSVQYGEYIMSYQDCRECHGSDLTGGVQGQMGPIGPGLSLVKGWSLEEFIATMRTGIDPNSHELNEQMPWRPIGKMDDDELGAIYEFLVHLPGF
jgi:cytochrome c553